MNIKDAKKGLKEELPGKDIEDLHELTKSPKRIFSDCYPGKHSSAGNVGTKTKEFTVFP